MKKIPTIVVTGGACAGKTTALALIQEWLLEREFQPVIVPEAATQLITSGLSPRSALFQESVLRKSIADEAILLDAIRSYGYKNPVLICDRGIPDQLGYVDAEGYAKLCEKYSLLPVEVRDARYDGVIFLRSAAIGAEAFYSLESNKARYETLEEARALDERTLQGWIGCPHLSIIENLPGISFDTKMQNAIAALARILGIPEPLEQERKYVLKNFSPSLIPQKAAGIDIVQTYLVGQPCVVERVRARGQDNVWVYFHTIKERRGSGVSVERESRISKHEFDNLLVRRDNNLGSIYKKRWCFEHKGHYCELDVFQGKLAPLVLLEIEYSGDYTRINVPEFLGKMTDETDNWKYSNRSLAEAA